MPKVIGQTSDGRDIIRHDPSEGCKWRCTTCGNFLRSQTEVHGHWTLFNEGHSMFEKLTSGQVYHQTVEGLYRRNMPPVQPSRPPESVHPVTVTGRP
jgi:hypothetical protein